MSACAGVRARASILLIWWMVLALFGLERDVCVCVCSVRCIILYWNGNIDMFLTSAQQNRTTIKTSQYFIQHRQAGAGKRAEGRPNVCKTLNNTRTFEQAHHQLIHRMANDKITHKIHIHSRCECVPAILVCGADSGLHSVHPFAVSSSICCNERVANFFSNTPSNTVFCHIIIQLLADLASSFINTCTHSRPHKLCHWNPYVFQWVFAVVVGLNVVGVVVRDALLLHQHQHHHHTVMICSFHSVRFAQQQQQQVQNLSNNNNGGRLFMALPYSRHSHSN